MTRSQKDIPWMYFFLYSTSIFCTWWWSNEWPKHVVEGNKLNVQFMCCVCEDLIVSDFRDTVEKVNLSLRKPWWHIHEVDTEFHSFVTSVMCSAVCSGCFMSADTTPRIHWTGGCVGPWACLDPLEERKISCPCTELKPRLSSPHPTHYTGNAIIASLSCYTNFYSDCVNTHKSHFVLEALKMLDCV
jgi:hypothetical protein